MNTRAARNRETLGDPRFDGEVALRSEIEELRAKSRDQANLIDRLQKPGPMPASFIPASFIPVSSTPTHATQAPVSAPDSADALASARDALRDAHRDAERDQGRLKAELAKAEARVLTLESGSDDVRAALEGQIRDFEKAARDHAAEMGKMKAALKAFADSASDPATGRASAAISAKVEISQLQAEVAEHRSTIESLRAEIAGSNERLVRQAQHFRDELRRLGSGAPAPGDSAVAANRPLARPSLAERISAPRVPVHVPVNAGAAHAPDSSDGVRDARAPAGSFLKALNGGVSDAGIGNAGDAVDEIRGRR